METSLSTKAFIKKFKMDQENYEFNRKEFLAELNNNFKHYVKQFQASSKDTQEGFTYDKFKKCVDQVEEKFWAISNKKVGLPFTTSLWSAFFAVYVVKMRTELFPDIQEFLDLAKKKNPTPIANGVTSNDLVDKSFWYGKNPSRMKLHNFNRIIADKSSVLLFCDEDNVSVKISIPNIVNLVEKGEAKWMEKVINREGKEIYLHHYITRYVMEV